MKTTKRTKHIEKLAAYSSQATICLLLTVPVSGQTVYTDLDPDLGEFTQYQDEDTVFQIDMNADGIVDFSFSLARYRYFSYFYSTYGNNMYVRNLDGIAAEPGLLSNILVMHEGDTIDAALNWNDGTDMLIATAGATANTYWYSTFYNAWKGGPLMDQDAEYAGVRFQIDGNIHYGWVRLSIKSNFSPDHFGNENYLQAYIMDYAYNATPGEPLLIDPENPIGVARHVFLKDVFDTGNTSDIFVSFTQPQSVSQIDSFRIIIVPETEAAHITFAQAIAAADYVSVGTGTGVTEIFLPDEMKDINGIDLYEMNKYCAVVLTMGNAASGFAHALSTPSFGDYYNLLDACEIPGEVSVDTIAANNILSDYQFNFNAADFEETIEEYRVMIISQETMEYGFGDDLFYLEGVSGFLKYVPVAPDGSASYHIQLPPTMFDTDGLIVSNGSYYVIAFGKRNGDMVNYSCRSGAAPIEFPAFDAIKEASDLQPQIYSYDQQLFIQLPDSWLTGETELRVYAVTGAEVLGRVLTNSADAIEITALPPGIYFAEIRNENRRTTCRFAKGK